MRIFKKSVYFLFESGSLDSPGGPSSNRRYSITGVLRRRVIMNFTSKGPAEAKSTITLRRTHLIRRPYAKRRGRRETMFDCPLSKTDWLLESFNSARTGDYPVAPPWGRSCQKQWRFLINALVGLVTPGKIFDYSLQIHTDSSAFLNLYWPAAILQKKS